MAPFVAILGLISICKRDNCQHMEAMDERGQRNFFHWGASEGGGQGGQALLPKSPSLAQEETEIREVKGEEFFSELVLLFRHLSATHPHLRQTQPGLLPVTRLDPEWRRKRCDARTWRSGV